MWSLQHRNLPGCSPLLLLFAQRALPFQFDIFSKNLHFTCSVASRCLSSTSANICLCSAFCLRASSCRAWWPPPCSEAATTGWGSKADRGDGPASNLCCSGAAGETTGLGNLVTEAPFDPNPMSRLKLSCLSTMLI